MEEIGNYTISPRWGEMHPGRSGKGRDTGGEVIDFEKLADKYFANVEVEPLPPPPPEPSPEEIRAELARKFHGWANQLVRQTGKDEFVYTLEVKRVLGKMLDGFLGSGRYGNGKGFLLIGPPGCGKTLVMRAWSFVFSDHPRGFLFKPCVEICGDFETSQKENLALLYNNFGRRITGWKNNLQFNHLCLDDLGKEEYEKAYSYNRNPLKIIINDRYDRRQHGIITHGTSNFDLEELTDLYGLAITDRMKELFNVIEWPQQTSYRK